ncbi:MAG: Kelch repeat-containing protein [Thermoplasmatota archaeon]
MGRVMPVGAAAVLVALLVGIPTNSGAHADVSLTVLTPVCQCFYAPVGNEGMSLASDGQVGYVFTGNLGDGQYSRGIWKIDPTVTPPSSTFMGDLFPANVGHTAAIWDAAVTKDCPAGCAYIFGGVERSGWTPSSTIWRFDPSQPALTAVATFPVGLYGVNAVFDGTSAYLFGGATGGYAWAPPFQASTAIWKFTPPATLERAASSLPVAQAQGSAVWDGKVAYIFGGVTADGTFSDQIFSYDPAAQGGAGALSELSTRLPRGEAFTTAVWEGDHALIFGGMLQTIQRSAKTIRFQPSPPVAADEGPGADLPVGWDDMASMAVGSNVYVMGGETSDGGRQQFSPAIYALEPVLARLGDPPLPVVPVQTVHEQLGTGVAAVLNLSPQVKVTYEPPSVPQGVSTAPPPDPPTSSPAPRGCTMDGVAAAGTTNADGSAVASDTAGRPFVVVHADVAVGCVARVRVELQSAQTQGAVSVHYYDGSQWRDLAAAATTGAVKGADGAHDLQVYGAGYDAVSHVAWAEVNHTSVFELAPTERAAGSYAVTYEAAPAAPGAGSGPPGWLGTAVAAVVVAALVLLAGGFWFVAISRRPAVRPRRPR